MLHTPLHKAVGLPLWQCQPEAGFAPGLMSPRGSAEPPSPWHTPRDTATNLHSTAGSLQGCVSGAVHTTKNSSGTVKPGHPPGYQGRDHLPSRDHMQPVSLQSEREDGGGSEHPQHCCALAEHLSWSLVEILRHQAFKSGA